VSELGRRVDELERDLLEGCSGRLGDQCLSECDGSLFCSDDTTFDHEEVFVDNTIMREATQWCDLLLCEISSSGGTVGASLSHSVDLFVDFCPVVVAILTCSRDRPLYSRWMPRSDASNFSETLVSFSGKTSGTPTGGDTLKTVPLRDTNHVNLFILLEQSVHRDLLLEQIQGEVNFLYCGPSVHLNFQDMSFLLSEVELSDLSVSDDSHYCTILFDSLDVEVNGSLLFGGLVFQSIFGECLLLGAIPILVEASSTVLGEMLGPNGGQRAEPLRCSDE